METGKEGEGELEGEGKRSQGESGRREKRELAGVEE